MTTPPTARPRGSPPADVTAARGAPTTSDDDDGVRDRSTDARTLRALLAHALLRVARAPTPPTASATTRAAPAPPDPLVLGDPARPRRVVLVTTRAPLLDADLRYDLRVTVGEGFGGAHTVPVLAELTRRPAPDPPGSPTDPVPDPTDQEDRGARPMTTATAATTATDDTTATGDAPRDVPPPLHLTLTDLRELDVCGPYLRTFGELFPTSRFPAGAPLDEATCREHAASFDWPWAASALLTYEGREEWGQLVRSRAAAWRRLGDGVDARRAAALGYLLHHRPELRSPSLLDVTVNRQARADDRALGYLRRGEEAVADAEARVAEWTRALDERRAALPALEAAAAGAARRRAARVVTERSAAVARAEADLAAARDRAARADAELAALLADAPADPTSDPTVEEPTP